MTRFDIFTSCHPSAGDYASGELIAPRDIISSWTWSATRQRFDDARRVAEESLTAGATAVRVFKTNRIVGQQVWWRAKA